MAKQTISVQAALGRLKIINARYERALQSTPFVISVEGGKVNGYRSPDAWKSAVRSNFDSARALLEEYRAIKAAITKSNAITNVTIAGREMTVAEAIEYKKSISMSKALVQKITNEYNTASARVTTANERARAAAEKAATDAFGKGDAVDPELFASVVRRYIERNGAELLDPLDAVQVIENLSKSVETFERDVDLVLTASNVSTMIEVDLSF